MKYVLTTIAAVVLVGCGESQQSTPTEETKYRRPATEVKVGIESEKFQISNPNEYKLFFSNLLLQEFITLRQLVFRKK